MDFTQSQKPGAGTVIVNKPLLTHVILCVLIGIVIGALSAGFYFKKISGTKGEGSATQASEKSVSATSQATPMPKIISVVAGTIEAVDANTLTFKTIFFGTEKIFKVRVTKDTKLKEKSAIQNQLEEKDIKIGDILPKSNAVIESSDNIKDKTEFDAKSVLILDVPAPPDAPKMDNPTNP